RISSLPRPPGPGPDSAPANAGATAGPNPSGRRHSPAMPHQLRGLAPMLNPSSGRPQPDSAPRARASGAIRALGLALLTLVGSGAALAEGSRHVYPADYFSRGTVAPNPAGAAQRAAVFTGTNYLNGVVTQRT